MANRFAESKCCYNCRHLQNFVLFLITLVEFAKEAKGWSWTQGIGTPFLAAALFRTEDQKHSNTAVNHSSIVDHDGVTSLTLWVT